MTTNLSPEIRQLPLYRDGVAAGTDIGLRIALDALTQERVRQHHIQAAHPDLRSPAAARAAYTDARLLEVSKAVGAEFRRGGAS